MSARAVNPPAPVALAARAFTPTAGVALAVYAVLALVLFGYPLFHPGAHACVCSGVPDAGMYIWAFSWWPRALLHGWNPFVSHLIYFPYGINVTHGTLVPGIALLFAPLTAIAGPMFSFNVAMLLSPVLAAFFAFLLCRRLTGSPWASLLGGWLFGFSAYMLGQMQAHLHLTWVFLLPAIVDLTLRFMAAEISRRRYVVLLTVALILQFSISAEVFCAATLFAALALGLAYAIGKGEARAAIHGLLVPVAAALGLTLLVVSPYLVYSLKPGMVPVLPGRANTFSADLLGFVVPTQLFAVGGHALRATSTKFTAGLNEGGSYLGIPLIVMAVLGAVVAFRRLAVKVSLAILLIAAVFSLGGYLHVGGVKSIRLPWTLAEHLPILGLMMPARFAVFAALAASVLATIWLARQSLRRGAWVLGILAVVALWPAVGAGHWRGIPGVPQVFTASRYRHLIGSRDVVLALPVGSKGQSMIWQSDASLRFRMVGGYVLAPEAHQPYGHFAIYPTLAFGRPVRHMLAAASVFLRRARPTVAVMAVGQAADSVWLPLLERLQWHPMVVDGAVLLRPAGFRTVAQAQTGRRLPDPASATARAVRRMATGFLRFLALGDANGVCSVLTPQAVLAELGQRSTAGPRCRRAVLVLLSRDRSLRLAARHAEIDAVVVHGPADYGYVQIDLPGVARDPDQDLVVSDARRSWQINGFPLPGHGVT